MTHTPLTPSVSYTSDHWNQCSVGDGKGVRSYSGDHRDQLWVGGGGKRGVPSPLEEEQLGDSTNLLVDLKLQ